MFLDMMLNEALHNQLDVLAEDTNSTKEDVYVDVQKMYLHLTSELRAKAVELGYEDDVKGDSETESRGNASGLIRSCVIAACKNNT